MANKLREIFLTKAEQLVSLIFDKLYELRRKPFKDIGIGSYLSVIKLRADMEKGKDLGESDFSSLEPRIYEIILFGSVAAGKAEPSDIDLMILDNGHFSTFFPCLTDKHHMYGGDWYEDLGNNLFWFMDGWFEVHEEQLKDILGDTDVDLHILPLRLLKSSDFRVEVAEKHKDPDFFKNAFKSALRFNHSTRQFELLTLDYLEKRYHCSLTDLQ